MDRHRGASPAIAPTGAPTGASPRGVPGAGHDVVVVQETAAGEITWFGGWRRLRQGPGCRVQPADPLGLSLTCVSRQLPADLDVALPGFEAVDGTHVVQPPTGHEVP